jgi:maltooligosyltrehalose trehalohydrolase
MYFTSHEDARLGEAVRRGRAAEFAAFEWEGEVADPQDPATFERCRLNHDLAGQGEHARLRAFYAAAIALRKALEAPRRADKERLWTWAYPEERVMVAVCASASEEVAVVLAFRNEPVTVTVPLPAGRWEGRLDSEATVWGGSGGAFPEVLESDGSVRIGCAGPAMGLWVRLRREAG